MNHFPGNPYAHNGIHITGGSFDDVARAIKLLAFEQRTANLQRQAQTVVDGTEFTDAGEHAYTLWERLQRDIGARLGAAPEERDGEYVTAKDIVNEYREGRQ